MRDEFRCAKLAEIDHTLMWASKPTCAHRTTTSKELLTFLRRPPPQHKISISGHPRYRKRCPQETYDKSLVVIVGVVVTIVVAAFFVFCLCQAVLSVARELGVDRLLSPLDASALAELTGGRRGGILRVLKLIQQSSPGGVYYYCCCRSAKVATQIHPHDGLFLRCQNDTCGVVFEAVRPVKRDCDAINRTYLPTLPLPLPTTQPCLPAYLSLPPNPTYLPTYLAIMSTNAYSFSALPPHTMQQHSRSPRRAKPPWTIKPELWQRHGACSHPVASPEIPTQRVEWRRSGLVAAAAFSMFAAGKSPEREQLLQHRGVLPPW